MTVAETSDTMKEVKRLPASRWNHRTLWNLTLLLFSFYVCGSFHHMILSIIVQRDAKINCLFTYCKVTLHASGVVAPIIRSI